MSKKDLDTMWSTGNKTTGLQRGFRTKNEGKWKGKVKKYRQLLKHIES